MDNKAKHFLDLLKPEYNDALKYCRALCTVKRADEAEDVLQQSFLKALENFESLRDKNKFRLWLFTIITREFYNSVRNDFWKRFISVNDGEEERDFPAVYSVQDENCNAMLIRKALSVISKEERTAVLLFEIGGFSIEEIREIQKEKSLSAVKSRLSRARKKLREFIEKEEANNSKQTINNSIFTGDISNETIRLIAEADGK